MGRLFIPAPSKITSFDVDDIIEVERDGGSRFGYVSDVLDGRYAPLSDSANYQATTRIEQVVATAGQETITFNNIPQNFDGLAIHWAGDGVSAAGSILLRFNNDSTANYDEVLAVRRSTTGTGSPTQSEGVTGIQRIGGVGASGGAGVIHIPGYTQTVANKAALAEWTEHAASSPYYEHRAGSGVWRSTAAITRIDLIANFSGYFAAGSVFTLVGVGGTHPS